MALQEATVWADDDLIDEDNYIDIDYFFGPPKLGAKTRPCPEIYKDYGTFISTETC